MAIKAPIRCTVIDFSTNEVITYIIPEDIKRKDVEKFVFDNTYHKQSNCKYIFGDNLKIGFRDLYK